MSLNKDEQLDELLMSWKSATDNDNGIGTEELRAKIKLSLKVHASHDKVVGDPSVTHDSPPPQTSSPTKLVPKVLFASLSIAALLLLAFVLRYTPTSADSATPPAFATISDQDVSNARELAREYKKLFGSAFEAALDNGTDVSVQVAIESVPNAESSDSSLVRICCAKRLLNGTWESVWLCDIITSDESVVRGRVATESQSVEIDLWTHRLPDGLVMVDIDLAQPLPDSPNLEHQVVSEEAGLVHKLNCTKINGREYCIFQSLRSLSREPI